MDGRNKKYRISPVVAVNQIHLHMSAPTNSQHERSVVLHPKWYAYSPKVKPCLKIKFILSFDYPNLIVPNKLQFRKSSLKTLALIFCCEQGREMLLVKVES